MSEFSEIQCNLNSTKLSCYFWSTVWHRNKRQQVQVNKDLMHKWARDPCSIVGLKCTNKNARAQNGKFSSFVISSPADARKKLGISHLIFSRNQASNFWTSYIMCGTRKTVWINPEMKISFYIFFLSRRSFTALVLYISSFSFSVYYLPKSIFFPII